MRVLQDIDWLLTSPPLLDHSKNFDFATINCPPRKRFNFTEQVESYRLGRYFEWLWLQLVENSESYRCLKNNWQLIIDKVTHGEFDSIIEDLNSKKNIHCELTVKFYLKVGSGEKLSDWVGPNLRDRFDLKYYHLLKQQLKLSEQPQVKRKLREHGLAIEQRKLVCRGRLFYPYQEFAEHIFTFPKQVTQEHEKGFWLTTCQVQELINFSSYQWYYLPKSYWLAELNKDNLSELKKINQVVDEVSQIIAFDPIIEKEVMRGFVVPMKWLTEARLRVLE